LRNSEPKKTSMILTALDGKSDISFVRANGHTFQDGDQVFLYKKAINPSDWYTFSTNKLPSGYSANIYTVFNVTGNSFQLAEPDGSEFATTSSVSDKKEFAVDVFLLATQENELPTTLTTDTTYGVLSVSVPSTGPKFLFQFTVEGAVAHEWANASTADVVRDRSYCATFVNAAGDESEPSVPSKVITVAPGYKVTFTQDDLPLTTWDTTKYPLAEYATPTELRLYRTDELGVFRLVTTGVKNEDNSTRTITWAALNTSGFTFVDTYPDTELGEPLMTTGWSVPVAGLRGLVNCPNGIVAGFRQNGIRLGSLRTLCLADCESGGDGLRRGGPGADFCRPGRGNERDAGDPDRGQPGQLVDAETGIPAGVCRSSVHRRYGRVRHVCLTRRTGGDCWRQCGDPDQDDHDAGTVAGVQPGNADRGPGGGALHRYLPARLRKPKGIHLRPADAEFYRPDVKRSGILQ